MPGTFSTLSKHLLDEIPWMEMGNGMTEGRMHMGASVGRQCSVLLTALLRPFFQRQEKEGVQIPTHCHPPSACGHPRQSRGWQRLQPLNHKGRLEGHISRKFTRSSSAEEECAAGGTSHNWARVG